MWIYQESTGAVSPVARHSAEKARLLPDPLPENKATAAVQAAGTVKDSPPVFSRTRKALFTDCWLLTGAFLLGGTLSGVMLALSASQQAGWLGYYLQAWLVLFGGTASKLFLYEYLTLSSTATILLTLGFSAFGPVLLFFFFMVYGAGSGILAVQLLAGAGWNAKLISVLFSSVPACVAAALLCILGGAALRVSGKIRAYSFRQGRAEPSRPNIRAFISQYLLTLALLLPLCGAATGLSCLGNRLL